MFSDDLENVNNMHRNAKQLRRPSRIAPAVTMANLSPLNWAGTNLQHNVHNDTIDVSGDSNYQEYVNNRYDPNRETWDMFVNQIV